MRKNLIRMLLIVCVNGALSSNSSAAGAPCDADDLPCIRRKLDLAEDDKERLKLQLEGKDKIIALSEAQLKIALEQNRSLQQAAEAALAAASKAGPKWYEHPALWVTVGLVVGTVVTVSVGAVVSRSWPAPAPVAQ